MIKITHIFFHRLFIFDVCWWYQGVLCHNNWDGNRLDSFGISNVSYHIVIIKITLDFFSQVAAEPSKSFKGKLLDYFDSVWNKFDFAIYSICIFTFVLKNFRPTYWVNNFISVVIIQPLFKHSDRYLIIIKCQVASVHFWKIWGPLKSKNSC